MSLRQRRREERCQRRRLRKLERLRAADRRAEFEELSYLHVIWYAGQQDGV